MTDAQLKNYLLLTCVLVLVVVVMRFFRERDYIFWDSSTYFILLSFLYIGVPAWAHLYQDISIIRASNETIRFSGQYSLYFLSILIIYYAFKIFLPNGRQAIPNTILLLPVSVGVIYLIYALITSYLFLVLYNTCPGLDVLLSNREMGNSFLYSINKTYKITFLFYTVASLILYLTLKKKGTRYVLMLIPFIAIDFITAGRTFLYQSLMVWLIIHLVDSRKLPIIKFALMGCLIISIEMYRTSWLDYFLLDRSFWFLPNEILITTETGFLIIDSDRSTDVFSYINYSIGKVLSPQIMSILYDEIPDYKSIIAYESNVETGMGGSLFTEVFSFKNTAWLIAYPFLAIIYLEFLNYLRRVAGFFGILVLLFYVMSTHSIFRAGFIFVGSEPIYYAIYAVSWYWFIAIFIPGRIKIPLILKTMRSSAQSKYL
jgi:hypothetical protein